MRQVNKVIQSKSINSTLSRIIGSLDVNGKGTEHLLHEVNPFILLDRAVITGPGHPPFGAHPHSGFSVASFFLSGCFKTWDNIQDKWEDDRVGGSVYYIHSGRGVVHDELSTGEGENTLFQLWMKLPNEEEKKKDATIQFASPQSVPEFEFKAVHGDSATIRLVLGSFSGHTSPIKLPTELFVLVVHQRPGSSISIPIPRGWNSAIVNNPLPGAPSSAKYANTQVDDPSIIVFGDGEFLSVTTEDSTAKYLVLAGAPIESPWVKVLGYNGAIIDITKEAAEAKMSQYEALKFDFGKVIIQ